MKRYVSYLFIAAAAFFVACGSDDNDNEPQDNVSEQLKGEWCIVDEPSDLALVLRLDASRTIIGTIYDNISARPEKEQISGSWNYYPSNKMLVLNRMFESELKSSSNNFLVQQIGPYVLQLRDQSTGAVERYSRFAASIDAQAGQQIDLRQQASFPKDFKATAFTSSNPLVATVSADGIVSVHGSGIAFISASSAEGGVVCLVNVPSHIDNYIAEVQSSIDAVLQTHGKPDVEGVSGQNMAVVYRQSCFDAALSAIQYQYDEKTRQVTRILTLYNSANDYEADAAEIRSAFFKHAETMYGPYEEYTRNTYLLSPFISDGACYVSYNNIKYFNQYNHF